MIYGKLKVDVGKILREPGEREGLEIKEVDGYSDHIHMFVRIPLKYSVLEAMGYLKGKSSVMIFDKHASLKYKY